MSLGSVALWSMLADEGRCELGPTTSGPLTVRPPHFTPTAKNVIFLFMVGAPSQVDLFDPKPALIERHGEPLPESILKQAKFAQIQEKRPKLMGSPYKFARYGESGASISELLPHTATIVDSVSFIRTLKADDVNHMFAELQMNTGSRQFGRPSIGSWVTYGLGSEARDLPGFIVMRSGMWPRSKSGNYSAGFLPSGYQAVPLRSSGTPILNLQSAPGYGRARQRRSIEAINRLNAARLEATGDPEIAARISAYEMAFRMQTSGAEVFNLRGETKSTLEAYGIDDPGKPSFARNCLQARRLVEHGVRFIQVFHGDWDHHTNIARRLPGECRRTDQPSAALVKDLAQRGLLDDTLVIWGGEFGRSSVAQTAPGMSVGRDHHIEAFTMWLAGGGVKAGHTVGATDELGYFATSHSHHIHDLQATILHVLGLDHEELTYRYQGRDFRLTDLYGNVIDELLA